MKLPVFTRFNHGRVFRFGLLALVLTMLLTLGIDTVVAGTINFNGHNPTFNIAYTDGNHARAYTAAPNMRQSSGSLDVARSSIWVGEAADTYVNFTFDTSGMSVFVVYTTDGSTPTKSNGTPVAGTFSKYDDPDRTWYATIPSQPAGTTVEYVFYISNTDLASGFGRVTANNGYETSWTEGDDAGFQYTVTPVHNITQGTDHPTVQDGVDNATAGDIIEIDPGTYNENVVIDKAITLQGAGIGSTILDGADKSATGGAGISIASDVDNVNIYDLSITQYETGILRAANSPAVTENIIIEDVNSSDNHEAGIHFSGSSDARNIRLTRVTANDNDGVTSIGRGFFMQSHNKENIVVEDGTFNNNRIAGIDLNIGSLDGVRITGNTVSSSNVANQTVDSGIGILGLVNSGTYANEISDNIVTVYGRFGIEIKGAQANGNTSGGGSLIIDNNTVTHADPGNPLNLGAAVENRDLAGIAVGDINSSGNPAGVVVQNNTVAGFRQSAGNTTPDPDTSTGFCISISGVNYLVTGNDVDNCDVGIQEQQGFVGNQNTTGDEYFGRDNATIACGTVTGNNLGLNTPNTVNTRQVGAIGTNIVTNSDTAESFCSIQAAIDDSDTTTGHTLVLSAGTYVENVTVNKELTLTGPNVGTAGNAVRVAEAIIDGDTGTAVTISANNVTLDGLNLTGSTGATLGNNSGAVIQNNLIETDGLGVQVSVNSNPFTIQDNAIALSQQVGAQPTVGIVLNGLSGATAPTIQDNDVADAFYGYLLHAVNTTAVTTINGGAISGVMQGVAVVNTLDDTNFFPSTFAVDGVTMSGFVGDYTAVPALAPFDFHSGVYVFTGAGTTGGSTITGQVTNVNVSDTGKHTANSSALQFADFGAQANAQTITVNGGSLTDNLNRGVFARGNAVVTVDGATLTDNGADPLGTGGNDGYAVIARNGASITVENSSVTNPAVQVSATSYAFHSSNGANNLLVRGNQISNGNIFQINTGSLTAYANNITSFADANLPGAGTVNARHNWWGTHSAQPTGVDNDSWNYRLGADVSSWGVSSLGSASLTAAGGSGTGVIVSHGRGLANVPFDKGVDPFASAMCSDYYDFFVIGSGNWTVSVPTDAGATCDDTRTNGALYQFVLTGDQPDTACVGGACWIVPTGVSLNANNLEVTVDADAILEGTPFVAGDATPDSNDPTAVALSGLGTSTPPATPLALLFVLLLAATGSLLWKRQRA